MNQNAEKIYKKARKRTKSNKRKDERKRSKKFLTK